jgi:hypothetical protein
MNPLAGKSTAALCAEHLTRSHPPEALPCRRQPRQEALSADVLPPGQPPLDAESGT